MPVYAQNPTNHENTLQIITGDQAGIWQTHSSANYAPNELIIKYKDTVSIPVETVFDPEKKMAVALPESINVLHQRYGVTSARPLFRASLTGKKTNQLLRRHDDRISSIKRRYPKRTARIKKTRPLPSLDNIYVITVSKQDDMQSMVKAFARDPNIVYAQPNYTAVTYMLPNDPFYSSNGSWGQTEEDLWGLKLLGMEPAWDITQGSGIVIAVVDTGIDPAHEDIAANVWVNPLEVAANGIDDDGNGYIDDTGGWDFISEDNTPLDGHGHGTHVSGTIAAIGNNSLGIIGVAPQASIMALKGLNNSGSGLFSGLASAIIYAADNGADIINNSWGCGARCPTAPLIEDAVRYAHGLGVVVVFAAGNGSDDMQYYSPQNLPESLVVAASRPDDSPASFTNYGILDVTAPGGGSNISPPAFKPKRNILSLKSSTCNAAMCPSGLVVNSNYLRQAGTSMAAPHVAGLAALVLANQPGYSPEQVRQVIRRGSDTLAATGFEPYSGYGRINAYSTLQEPQPLSVLLGKPVASVTPTILQLPGIAFGPGFDRWQLDFGSGANPTSWTDIAIGTQAMSNEITISDWDISLIADGDYTIRLRAWNISSEVYEDRHPLLIDQVFIISPSTTFLEIFRGGELVTLTGTVAPGNFSSYDIRIQDSNNQFLTSPAVSLTNSGQQQVFNDVLGTWDTTGVANDHYTIHVDVQLNGGGSISETVNVVVDADIHEGWPINLGLIGNQSVSYAITDHVTIADINGDGNNEVLVGYGSEIRIFDGSGQLLPGWPQSVDPNGFNSSVQKAPAVGDLNGDGRPEIVSGNNTHQILVWQADGTPLPGWPRLVGGGLHSLAIGDMNNDGLNDVIATDWSYRIKVFDHTGSYLPGWPQVVDVGSDFGIMSQPGIGDVDNDGDNEIVVIGKGAPSRLFIYQHDGTVMPGWPIDINPSSPPEYSYRSTPAIGDLDGDGDLEIVVGDANGMVHAFHHDGSSVAGWPQATRNFLLNSPVIADIDNDGTPEVIIGLDGVIENSTRNNYIYIWRNDGSLLPGWPVQYNRAITASSFGYGTPAVADIDNDGINEIIVSSDAAYGKPFALNAYHMDGSIVSGFPKPTADIGAFVSNTAAIGDVDGDGRLELAWIDADANLYLYDLDGAATNSRQWPMYHHDPMHTGLSGNAITDLDINNDGIVNSQDLGVMMSQWGNSGSADLNGDGNVGVADLELLY